MWDTKFHLAHIAIHFVTTATNQARPCDYYSVLNFCFGLTCCVFTFFLGGVTESVFFHDAVKCVLPVGLPILRMVFVILLKKSQLIWINGSINTKTPRPLPSFRPWLTHLVLQSMKITNSSWSKIDLNFICVVSCSVHKYPLTNSFDLCGACVKTNVRKAMFFIYLL